MGIEPTISGIVLVKGIREPHEVKKKSFDLGGNRIHDLRNTSTVTLPTRLRGRTEKVGDDLGGESRRRESKGTNECCAACGSLIPFTRANAQWVIHRLN